MSASLEGLIARVEAAQKLCEAQYASTRRSIQDGTLALLVVAHEVMPALLTLLRALNQDTSHDHYPPAGVRPRSRR